MIRQSPGFRAWCRLCILFDDNTSLARMLFPTFSIIFRSYTLLMLRDKIQRQPNSTRVTVSPCAFLFFRKQTLLCQPSISHHNSFCIYTAGSRYNSNVSKNSIPILIQFQLFLPPESLTVQPGPVSSVTGWGGPAQDLLSRLHTASNTATQ